MAMMLLWPYRTGSKEEERSQGVDSIWVRGGKKTVHKRWETIHPEDPSAKQAALRLMNVWVFESSTMQERGVEEEENLVSCGGVGSDGHVPVWQYT